MSCHTAVQHGHPCYIAAPVMVSYTYGHGTQSVASLRLKLTWSSTPVFVTLMPMSIFLDLCHFLSFITRTQSWRCLELFSYVNLHYWQTDHSHILFKTVIPIYKESKNQIWRMTFQVGCFSRLKENHLAKKVIFNNMEYKVIYFICFISNKQYIKYPIAICIYR